MSKNSFCPLRARHQQFLVLTFMHQNLVSLKPFYVKLEILVPNIFKIMVDKIMDHHIWENISHQIFDQKLYWKVSVGNGTRSRFRCMASKIQPGQALARVFFELNQLIVITLAYKIMLNTPYKFSSEHLPNERFFHSSHMDT